jgi:hypothetical protein
MVHRMFSLGLAEDAALLRLGTALILKWSLLPSPVQDQLIQQALAIGDQDPEVMRGIIERLLARLTAAERLPSPSNAASLLNGGQRADAR